MEMGARPRPHWSMYYLIGYLAPTGLAFLSAPAPALRVLGATGTYSDVMVRTVGSFMIALAVLVTQAIRHRLEAIVRTTVFVRLFFLGCFTAFFVSTGDPLFVAILGVVGLGVVLTCVDLWRRGQNPFSVKGL